MLHPVRHLRNTFVVPAVFVFGLIVNDLQR